VAEIGLVFARRYCSTLIQNPSSLRSLRHQAQMGNQAAQRLDFGESLFQLPDQLLAHTFCLALVKGDIDRDLQIPFLVGLQQVSKRFGELGPCQHVVSGVSAEEDNPDSILGPECFGTWIPSPCSELDVQEHQIWRGFRSESDRLFPRHGNPDHLVAKRLQARLQVAGDDGLVLHDQDSRSCSRRVRGHDVSAPSFEASALRLRRRLPGSGRERSWNRLLPAAVSPAGVMSVRLSLNGG